MRRNWIKLYVDQTLRGSMIEELSPDQRWMFVGLILLAGDSSIPGVIFKRKNEDGILIGYSTLILADILGVEEEALKVGLERMVVKDKISINDLGVITIINWGKYQSEYERTKDAPSRCTKVQGDSVQKYGLDREGDVDRERDVEEEQSDDVKPTTAKISFNPKTRSWEGITAEDMESWAKAYPACDINVELAKAGEWLIANPTKTKSNYRRFIVNWLSRTQDRGGSGGGQGYAPYARPEYKTSQVGEQDGEAEEQIKRAHERNLKNFPELKDKEGA